MHTVNNFLALAGEWLVQFALKLIIAIVVFLVAMLVIKWITKKLLPNMLKKSKITPEVHIFIISAIRIVLYIVVALGCINILGFQTTSLIALLSTAGLAVGLSLQGSLSNFAGGMLLLIFKPFKRGDYIKVNSLEGYVDSVGILYTKLKTLDNRAIMLPNGNLSNSNITNYDCEPVRRLDIEFNIPYGEDIKRARDVIVAAMKTNEFIVKDKPIETVVKDFASDGVLLQSRSWVTSEQYWNAYFSMHEIIAEALQEAAIDIPYSQLHIHVSDADKAASAGKAAADIVKSAASKVNANKKEERSKKD